MIYSSPSSFHLYWRNDLGGTGYQGKYLFNKTEKITLVVMTSYSMMRWLRKASMQHSTVKQ